MARTPKKRPPRGLSLLKRLEAKMYWSLCHASVQEFTVRMALYVGASDMYSVLKHKKVKDE